MQLDDDTTVAQILGKVKSIYFRVDAEGNPFHKALSRDIAPEGAIELDYDGLQGSKEWHRDEQVKSRNVLTKDGRNPLDRAILAQTVENYAILKSKYPECESLDNIPGFAENFIIEGFSSKEVCVGDIFDIKRKENEKEITVGTIQISNPRRPCYKIKMRHSDGVCMYSAGNGLAGMFFRVLEAGSLKIGDSIVLKERLHPKYTLERISQLLYSETNLSYEIPRWIGAEEEINEIIELKELGMFRWKEVVIDFVNNREAREKKWQEKQLKAAQLEQEEKEQLNKPKVVESNQFNIGKIIIPVLVLVLSLIFYFSKINIIY